MPRPEYCHDLEDRTEDDEGPHGAVNDDEPIRLLVFSHNLNHEGASISLKELICRLVHRASVSAEVISFQDGPLRTSYEEHEVPLRILPGMLHRISTPKRLEVVVKNLASIVKASGAHIVLANTLLNFPVVLAAQMAGVPSVWVPRESEAWDAYFRFLPDPVAQRAVAAIFLPRKVVFVAESTREVWREFERPGRFTVIRNALDVERFAGHLAMGNSVARSILGWGEKEIVVLGVGTVCERKGQEDAVLALKEIADRPTNPIRLVFAGDARGAYGRRLKRIASSFRMRGAVKVEFVQTTDDIGHYYAGADIFVMCSRMESHPRAVLEAMAFGLPIISTPVFGVTEQLPDADDAVFYQPGDVSCLAEQLHRFANSRELRESFGKRSKERFLQMPSLDDLCECYLSIFRDARRPA